MMKKKKLTAAMLAASLCIGALPVPGAVSAEALKEPIKVEFESGTLTDCEEREPITWKQVDEDGFGNPCDMTGWSGDAFVYIDRKDATAAVKVTVPEEGFYKLDIAYIQCFGNPEKPDKTQYLLVNGVSQGEILFPFNSGRGWEELPAGYVFLKKGENEIAVKSYWGYTFLDYIKLSNAPEYLTSFEPAEAPCDPKASPEAQKLYAYLRSVYGKHILSGQQEYCGSHNYNKDAHRDDDKIDYLVDNEAEFEYIQEKTGKQPAIRGIDFLFYNTTQPYFDDAPERVVAWYKDKGGIPTVTYHWNVPCDGKDSKDAAFYVASTGNTPSTNFSVTKAVEEGTWEHEKIDEDIALLAEQLKKAADAGVPILFRPLHEAEGGWFWWGAEGAEPCVKLYRYLYDQLTNQYGLHNLLWIWTGSTSAHAADWYPGDEYVDFIGCDKYNAINNNDPNYSAISATFYSMVSQTEGQKMVVMSENDTIPSLENLLAEKAAWLYFCPWYQRYLTGLNGADELKTIYTSDYCITLDELPDWDTYDPELPPVDTTKPAETTKLADTTGTTVSTTAASVSGTDAKKATAGDANSDGKITVSDAILMARIGAEDKTAQITEEGKRNADLNGNGKIDAEDTTTLLQFLAGLTALPEK